MCSRFQEFPSASVQHRSLLCPCGPQLNTGPNPLTSEREERVCVCVWAGPLLLKLKTVATLTPKLCSGQGQAHPNPTETSLQLQFSWFGTGPGSVFLHLACCNALAVQTYFERQLTLELVQNESVFIAEKCFLNCRSALLLRLNSP